MRRLVAAPIAFVLLGIAPPLAAQDTLQPLQGGTIHAVGLPALYKPYAGVGIGFADNLTSQARFGVYRDLKQADIGILGWSLEYQAGVLGNRFDHGLRALFETRALGIAAGASLRLPDSRGDAVLALTPPLRRGGILGAGTDVRFEWSIPLGGHHGTLNAVLRVPLWQNLGTSRARVAHVDLDELPNPPVPFPGASDPALAAALERVRTDALWIGRVIEPALGQGGRPAQTSAAALQPVVDRLGAEDSATSEMLIVAYHDDLRKAFAAAVATSAAARADSADLDSATAKARKLLLDYMLLPYNRYLGQRKRHDSARILGLTARSEFDRWMIAQRVPAARQAALRYVFAALTEDVDAVRAELAAARGGDTRLVFLPLQLALLPQEYDEIEEIDTLISHAVQSHAFTHGNRIQYLQAERFQQLLIQSIHDAREYHVLWIHDIRGRNLEGVLDRQSVVLAAQGYLAALRERVLALDSTQQLPVYMIFLDQHYFEANGSRPLLSFLQSPLSESVRFAGVTDSERVVLAAYQDSLRRAVDSSATLTVLRATWGEAWLRRLVGVRVSITNPADPSFRSPIILPLMGAPDDLMRDHRKIILYDVSEEDPYRGMAIYTGMGVGEHYTGPMWEDRAMSLQGPAALSLRDQAVALLAMHGIRGNEVPALLRRRRMPTDYREHVQAEVDSLDLAHKVATRAIELHNPTGFAEKEIAVADATLFSLLPPGGVLKIPDSLWMNELYASLLAGAALRGVRVLMIMPGSETAPSEGFPQLAMMHDLASRVVAAQQALAPALARSGGQLHLGIYDPAYGMDNMAGRLRALRARLDDTPWLRELYGFTPSFYTLLDHADSLFPRPAGAATAMRGGDVERPTLHFKGFLYIAGPPWRELVGGAGMADAAFRYYSQRWRQLLEGGASSENEMTNVMMQAGADIISKVLESQPTTEGRNCPPGVRECGGGTWAMWLQVGSQNLDYRSMTMDGEAAVLVSNWTALLAVLDFVQLTGLTTWVESQGQLDRLFTPPSALKLRLARWTHLAL